MILMGRPFRDQSSPSLHPWNCASRISPPTPRHTNPSPHPLPHPPHPLPLLRRKFRYRTTSLCELEITKRTNSIRNALKALRPSLKSCQPRQIEPSGGARPPYPASLPRLRARLTVAPGDNSAAKSLDFCSESPAICFPIAPCIFYIQPTSPTPHEAAAAAAAASLRHYTHPMDYSMAKPCKRLDITTPVFSRWCIYATVSTHRKSCLNGTSLRNRRTSIAPQPEIVRPDLTLGEDRRPPVVPTEANNKQ